MTEREETLCGWLRQACCLLEVEANDHRLNHQWDIEKRDRIAKTLRTFVARAKLAIEAERV